MDFLRSAPLRCLPWNPGRFECGHGNSPIFFSSPKKTPFGFCWIWKGILQKRSFQIILLRPLKINRMSCKTTLSKSPRGGGFKL